MLTIPEILYEDNHLLIVNKRPGILVQGDETGDTPLVEICKQYIKEKYNKPGAAFLGVVHRLDRPVSGAVVFARTSKALSRMNAAFREKSTQKTYWAICTGRPASVEGTLIHWLVKDEKKNKTTAYQTDPGSGKRSELHYKLLSTSGAYSLIEVRPVTGRSHQIRVQLASVGCPIAGDLKYGSKETHENASICLHARRLEFVHPVARNPLTVTAKPPAFGLWGIFA